MKFLEVTNAEGERIKIKGERFNKALHSDPKEIAPTRQPEEYAKFGGGRTVPSVLENASGEAIERPVNDDESSDEPETVSKVAPKEAEPVAEAEKEVKEEPLDAPSEPKTGVACPECDFVAKTKGGLNLHMKKHK